VSSQKGRRNSNDSPQSKEERVMAGSTRKRDEKADFKLKSKEEAKGASDDEGNFSNFPQISQKSVELLKGRGIISLFPI